MKTPDEFSGFGIDAISRPVIAPKIKPSLVQTRSDADGASGQKGPTQRAIFSGKTAHTVVHIRSQNDTVPKGNRVEHRVIVPHGT